MQTLTSNSLAGNSLARSLATGKSGGLPQADPLQTLLTQFNGAGDEVAIRCNISGATTTYVLSQHLGNRKYYCAHLYSETAMVVGNEMMYLNRSNISTLYGGYNDQSTPATTWNSAWTAIANATYPGGRLLHTNVAGRYIQLQTQEGAENIGLLFPNGGTNVGLALITINGDNTLATELPTAQQLVDAGTYANTILVANGGSLNPTDRVLDQYGVTANYSGPGAGAYQLFAKNMTPGVHTVRITATGYKRAAATDARTVMYLILVYGKSLHNIASPTYEACLLTDIDLCSTIAPPRVEISYSTRPTGAVNKEWIGHSGSLKYTESPVVTVDGVITPLVHLQTVTGAESIVVDMQFGARHTEIGAGATNIGLMDIQYTMRPATGLWITHALAWSMSGVASSYPCMMTVGHNVFDRFNTLGSGTPGTDLTIGDNSRNFNTSQGVGYAWDFDGKVGMLMHIPDLTKTVEDWSNTFSEQLWWSDIGADGGTWKKLYATRFQSDEAFTNTTVWQSEANYRAQWFQEGANAALSTANGQT
jgi:hypothetical protein